MKLDQVLRMHSFICRSHVQLASKAIQSASLPLEGIDNIHSSDSLPLGVLSVSDGIPDDVLKEDLEDSTGLLVDESRDTLDSSTASQPSDGRLGDTLDVVSQHFPVTLGTSLPKSLSTLASSMSTHCVILMSNQYFQ